MAIAKDALKLFIRSLPEGCTFSIISFGTRHEPLLQNTYYQTYCDKTRNIAIAVVDRFKPDFGGTNILKPLKAAQVNEQYNSGLKKRIFLLTDGCVSNAAEIEKQARCKSNKIRVFTFGLGQGCDRDLVTKVAQAGRGTHTIVEDGSADLNGKVIRALGNAIEPSLKGVKFGWNGTPLSNEKEVFRNTLISSTKLCSAEEFESISFFFKSD